MSSGIFKRLNLCGFRLVNKYEPYCRCPISELFHCCLDQGSLVISRVETWSDPTIYSVTTSIMITNSNSLQ